MKKTNRIIFSAIVALILAGCQSNTSKTAQGSVDTTVSSSVKPQAETMTPAVPVQTVTPSITPVISDKKTITTALQKTATMLSFMQPLMKQGINTSKVDISNPMATELMDHLLSISKNTIQALDTAWTGGSGALMETPHTRLLANRWPRHTAITDTIQDEARADTFLVAFLKKERLQDIYNDTFSVANTQSMAGFHHHKQYRYITQNLQWDYDGTIKNVIVRLNSDIDKREREMAGKQPETPSENLKSAEKRIVQLDEDSRVGNFSLSGIRNPRNIVNR